ncbi:MAG: type II secretion system F family protein [Phycisphaerae bacterium]|nr:MAG: type II secretion system F family protein [Planctomycetota bacterium]KAB2949942.1 MAG: type II secretion system F family protein [Phycisphaerae bacterium]MBE7458571.1 type II secretion system F family protein [Planctomycetia bacterium]MCK6465028.1 type II secretion system F family protein [Phycisphaerae bacterium]MCL4718674.1 type II secretion system F family protein [Phycisphaerae bacterium]
MNLSYEAVDAAGSAVADVIDATDAAEAIERLRRRGLFVKKISEVEAAKATTARAPATLKLPLKPLVFLTRQLAILLKAGSALVPALQVIRRQLKKPAHEAMLRSLINDLEDGLPLADAMRKFPETFDPAYRAVVAAGEASATLPAMMERLASILVRRRALRNKILGAMTYPLVLLVMSINVVCGMMMFVVPRFAGMFKTIGVEIPWSTQFLLNVSGWLEQYWAIPAGAAIVLGVGLFLLLGSKPGRRVLVNVQTEIPLMKRLTGRLIQARIYRTLGTLIECRVGVLDALELSREITGNRRFRRLFDDIVEALTSGDRISSVLLRSDFIEPSLAYSIQTGEENGALGPSISYCADILEEENAELIAAMTRLVEPMILVVMGVVVGGVAISLFLPLFDVTAALG